MNISIIFIIFIIIYSNISRNQNIIVMLYLQCFFYKFNFFDSQQKEDLTLQNSELQSKLQMKITECDTVAKQLQELQLHLQNNSQQVFYLCLILYTILMMLLRYCFPEGFCFCLQKS